MKNIELTEKHKSKLLEMCEKLFPKYFYWEMDNDNITSHLIGNDTEIYEDEIPDLNIHWFEFCITEIVNELSWKNIKTDILADCEYEDFRMKLITNIFKDKLTTKKFHIIDYLYEEFKKLK